MGFTPTETIWFNGQLVEWDKATIHVLSHVQGSGQLAEKAAPLVNTMITTYLRV